MPKKFTHEQLREMFERVTAEGYAIDEEAASELETTMDRVLTDTEAEVMRAAIRCCELAGVQPDADQFEKLCGNEFYRGEWRTPGEYTKHYFSELHADNEQAQQLLRELTPYVDWEAYADTPEMGDYTFVTLDGNVHRVYVFEHVDF